jgi:hypothetical protein
MLTHSQDATVVRLPDVKVNLSSLVSVVHDPAKVHVSMPARPFQSKNPTRLTAAATSSCEDNTTGLTQGQERYISA